MPVDDGRKVLRLFRGIHAEQGLGIALDGGQRRTQLMGDIGHEIAADALQLHQVADVAEDQHRAQTGIGQYGQGDEHREDPAAQMQLHLAQGTGHIQILVPVAGGRAGHLGGAQHGIHGILQFGRGDHLDDRAARHVGHLGEEAGKGAVAAADAALRPQHQHAVTHGVEHALQLGGLVRGDAHLLADAVGHAVHGFGQGGELRARQTAQAALQAAAGNGRDHVHHLAQGPPHGAGDEGGQHHGQHHGQQDHGREDVQALLDEQVHAVQWQGQTQDAPVRQVAGRVGKILVQGAAGAQGVALPFAACLHHFGPVAVVVHAFGRNAAGLRQHVAVGIQQRKSQVGQVEHPGQDLQIVFAAQHQFARHARLAQQTGTSFIELARFQPFARQPQGKPRSHRGHQQDGPEDPGPKRTEHPRHLSLSNGNRRRARSRARRLLHPVWPADAGHACPPYGHSLRTNIPRPR